MTAKGDTRPAWARAVADWLLIVIGFIVYWRLLPHGFGADGNVRFGSLVELFENRRLSAARYSIVVSILGMPFYWLGKHLTDPAATTALLNTFVFFAGLGAMHASMRRLVDPASSRRIALVLIVGSMFANHVQFFYGEVATAVGLMLGVVWFARDRPLPAALVWVVAIVNTPVVIVGAALSAAVRAVQTRRWVVTAGALALSVGLVLLENKVRRGNAFDGGYKGDRGAATALPYSGKPEFSYPFVLGFASLLLSFGKGLFFFAPGLLLFVAPSLRKNVPAPLASLVVHGIWVTLGIVLAYSKWWAWYGGVFWGPRFLLFASFPASWIVASCLASPPERLVLQVVVLFVVVLSLWVGLDGAVWSYGNLSLCESNGYTFESFCWYVPEFSPLVRPFIVPKVLTHDEVLTCAYFIVVGIYLSAPLAWLVTRGALRGGVQAVRAWRASDAQAR